LRGQKKAFTFRDRGAIAEEKLKSVMIVIIGDIWMNDRPKVVN